MKEENYYQAKINRELKKELQEHMNYIEGETYMKPLWFKIILNNIELRNDFVRLSATSILSKYISAIKEEINNLDKDFEKL